jgi:hypothetical protein
VHSISNMEIKSYWHLIFFMKDCSIGTILSHKQQSNSGMENSLFENISGEGVVQLFECMHVHVFLYFFSSVCFLMLELFYSKSVWTDSMPVQWYRKWSHWGVLTFEFILIFDLEYGNKILLTFDFFYERLQYWDNSLA